MGYLDLHIDHYNQAINHYNQAIAIYKVTNLKGLRTCTTVEMHTNKINTPNVQFKNIML